MGTYLKLIESDKIGSNEQRSFMNHHKDQPNNGPTIYKFKNSKTNISRLAVVDKSYLFDYDNETDFTWRFGYKDGFPGIYITLHAISDTLKYNENAVICLETNSCTSKKNMEFGLRGFDGEIMYELENITWINLSEMTSNKEYFIYICGKTTLNSPKGPWYWVGRRKIIKNEGKLPDDWIMTINIRPTIKFKNQTGHIYTNYKALAKYEEVTYLYNSEYRY